MSAPPGFWWGRHSCLPGQTGMSAPPILQAPCIGGERDGERLLWRHPRSGRRGAAAIVGGELAVGRSGGRGLPARERSVLPALRVRRTGAVVPRPDRRYRIAPPARPGAAG